jgi:hypothetical protein
VPSERRLARPFLRRERELMTGNAMIKKLQLTQQSKDLFRVGILAGLD